MKFFFQLFVCFGIPLIGIFIYRKLFAKVEDNTVFKIGFANTVNYLLWFTQISTILFWGISGMNVLAALYLMFIAPILSVGFIYWILLHKDGLTRYYYALISSATYLAVILIIFTGILLSP